MAGLCLTLFVNGQPWVNTYNPGSNLNVLTTAIPMPDGGFVASGWLTDPVTGAQQSFVIRADNEGEVIYENVYNFNQTENPRGIIAHEDESLTMLLHSASDSEPFKRSLVNFDPDGNVTSMQEIHTNVHWLPFELLRTSDDHYLMAGICICGTDNPKTLVAKTDMTGDTLWTRLLPGFYNLSKLVEEPGGNYWLAGLKGAPEDTSEPVVKKIDPNGVLLDEQIFELNNPDVSSIVDITFSHDQDVVLFLIQENIELLENDYRIIITDNNTELVSSIEFGILTDRTISDIELLGNDKIILGGTILDENLLYQAWLGITDFNNGEIEVKVYGEPFKQESGGFLFITPGNRAILVGESEGGDDEPQVVFAVIDQLEGPTTATNDLDFSKKEVIAYPNPVSDQVIIDLHPSIPAIKNLELISSKGTLLDRFSFDQQMIEINLQNYPPGIYFYRIQSNNQLFGYGKLIKN